VNKVTRKPSHSTWVGWQPSSGFSWLNWDQIGENIGARLFWKKDGDKQATYTQSLAKAWLQTSMINNELKRFRYVKYGQNDCWTSGQWKRGDCAHYSQIIWADTTQVGCGYANCNSRDDGGYDGTWMVCHYYPAGNVLGNFPYKQNGQCSSSGSVITTTANPADCVEVSGFPSVKTYTGKNLQSLNGQWWKDGNAYKKGSLKFTWASNMQEWWVDLNWANYGWCKKGQGNIKGCSGLWKYRNSQNKERSATTVKFKTCGTLDTEDPPCFDDYASTLDFRKNDSHSGLHFERVDAAGCVNDAPQWTSENGNSSYRLLFQNGDMNDTSHNLTHWMWQIYDELAYHSEYPFPKYACNESHLHDCGEGKWAQVVSEAVDETGDDWTGAIDLGNLTNETNVTADDALSAPLSYVLDYMMLSSAKVVPTDGFGEESSVFNWAVIAALCAIVLLTIVVIVGVCCVMRKRKKQQAVMQEMEVVADDEEVDVAYDEAAGTTEQATMM